MQPAVPMRDEWFDLKGSRKKVKGLGVKKSARRHTPRKRSKVSMSTAQLPEIDLAHLFSQALEDEQSAAFADAVYPFLDLTAPGMPPAGPNFIQHAIDLGDSVDQAALKKEAAAGRSAVEVHLSAVVDRNFVIPIQRDNRPEVSFVPGHIWRNNQSKVYGPKRARQVMVSKLPGRDDWGTSRSSPAGSVKFSKTRCRIWVWLPKSTATGTSRSPASSARRIPTATLCRRRSGCVTVRRFCTRKFACQPGLHFVSRSGSHESDPEHKEQRDGAGWQGAVD
jgi:hypothetical protein